MIRLENKIKLMKAAISALGKPYIFGVEVRLKDKNPRAFDCSELVEWLYYQAGFLFLDGSRNQYDHCEIIKTTGQPLATGDLVFASRGKLKVGHVGVIIIPDRETYDVIEARNKRVGVVKTRLTEFISRSSFVGIGRPLQKYLRPV